MSTTLVTTTSVNSAIHIKLSHACGQHPGGLEYSPLPGGDVAGRVRTTDQAASVFWSSRSRENLTLSLLREFNPELRSWPSEEQLPAGTTQLPAQTGWCCDRCSCSHQT